MRDYWSDVVTVVRQSTGLCQYKMARFYRQVCSVNVQSLRYILHLLFAVLQCVQSFLPELIFLQHFGRNNMSIIYNCIG